MVAGCENCFGGLLMKQKYSREVQKGLEEHYALLNEEFLLQKAIDERTEKELREQWREKVKTLELYFSENKFDVCNRCHKDLCLLMDTASGCGYIGRKLEANFDGEMLVYFVVETPKGVWDEGFVPLTDSQINQIGIIF